MAAKKSKQLNFFILDKEFCLDVNADIEDFLREEIQACNHKLAELRAGYAYQNLETTLSMYILWRAGKYAEEKLQIQEQLDNYRAQLQGWQEQMSQSAEEEALVEIAEEDDDEYPRFDQD